MAGCIINTKLTGNGGGQQDYERNVGFEVLTAVVLKSTIFWDITPCRPLSQLTFRRNISPPPSGAKNKVNKKPA
jgi:hypothetical protein